MYQHWSHTPCKIILEALYFASFTWVSATYFLVSSLINLKSVLYVPYNVDHKWSSLNECFVRMHKVLPWLSYEWLTNSTNAQLPIQKGFLWAFLNSYLFRSVNKQHKCPITKADRGHSKVFCGLLKLQSGLELKGWLESFANSYTITVFINCGNICIAIIAESFQGWMILLRKVLTQIIHACYLFVKQKYTFWFLVRI